MKITIDAYNIALPQGTGVATYGRTLVRAATEVGHKASVLFGTRAGHSKVPLLNEIALAEGEQMTSDKPHRQKLLRSVAQGITGIISSRQALEVPMSGQVILPNGLRLGTVSYANIPNLYSIANSAFRLTKAITKVACSGTDLAHWTYPLPIKVAGACNVYTLHDLVPLRLPYTTADTKRAYYRLCKRIARDADHILTVSECSRRDIIEILGVEENRVTNLYQPSYTTNLLQNVDEAQIVRYVEGLLNVGMRDYYLFFGAIEPKKNLARLIEAFLGSTTDAKLVIVGAPGWGGEKDVSLLKSLVSLDARNRIIWMGYLPREMLTMIIAGARATLFPSLYEGFGLPVLESMALGTPVITSNLSSLPEVAGEAGLLVDPYDVRSISNAIMSLDNDKGTREDLSQRGLAQAQKFSSNIYKQRLSDFYKYIL
jgi:glycosyltransferase involved in cell wall biosynthesis